MRLAAALLLALGVVLGSWPRPRAAPPPRADGFWLVSGDFHVHGFFGDGALPPWELRRQARRGGLDVIVLSNHNQLLGWRLFPWVFASRGRPLLIPAEEVTAPGFHLIAVGVRRRVSWRQPAAGVIRDIHAQGGVAIAAHPRGSYVRDLDSAAISQLDGVEVAHPSLFSIYGRTQLPAFYAQAQRLQPRIAPMGSSDMHIEGRLGRWRTFLLVREVSERGVLDAIRAGRTVAMDSRGGLHGEAALVQRVTELRRGRAEPELGGRRERLASTCAWLGALGLVLAGVGGGRAGGKG